MRGWLLTTVMSRGVCVRPKVDVVVSIVHVSKQICNMCTQSRSRDVIMRPKLTHHIGRQTTRQQCVTHFFLSSISPTFVALQNHFFPNSHPCYYSYAFFHHRRKKKKRRSQASLDCVLVASPSTSPIPHWGHHSLFVVLLGWKALDEQLATHSPPPTRKRQ